ncbi:hypothetical protein TNCV_1993731 [Trichonephila clavipes]|nr:hypothetical protein TNCV_1993731 [Trichonephila clavipes]
MSSSPASIKIHRVGKRYTLNLSRAQTSFRWCGVVVRRRGCQLRYRPRHLIMVQNNVRRANGDYSPRLSNPLNISNEVFNGKRHPRHSCLLPIINYRRGGGDQEGGGYNFKIHFQDESVTNGFVPSGGAQK